MKSNGLITSSMMLLQTMSIFYLLSCSTAPKNITIPIDTNIRSREMSAKIPLSAGLYLSQGFKEFKYSYYAYRWRYGDVLVGDALSKDSEMAMRNIFQEVYVVDSLDDNLSNKYDVILTPQLIKLDQVAQWVTLEGQTVLLAEVVIKWSIVRPDGKLIYLTTIRGEGKKRDLTESLLDLALKDQFQKAQEDIYTNGWWKKQWWKKDPGMGRVENWRSGLG